MDFNKIMEGLRHFAVVVLVVYVIKKIMEISVRLYELETRLEQYIEKTEGNIIEEYSDSDIVSNVCLKEVFLQPSKKTQSVNNLLSVVPEEASVEITPRPILSLENSTKQQSADSNTESTMALKSKKLKELQNLATALDIDTTGASGKSKTRVQLMDEIETKQKNL